MANQIELDYALMAGRAYQTTRNKDSNWFPIPTGWTEFLHAPSTTYPTTSGFEAVSFQSTTNPNLIVISFAGTYPKDVSGDIAADIGLASGSGSAQLMQAVEYYLQIKAANPDPNTKITLTGHSLGGGLAALVGVFFGVQAVTFDQAPFAQTARFKAAELMAELVGKHLSATATDKAAFMLGAAL